MFTHVHFIELPMMTKFLSCQPHVSHYSECREIGRYYHERGNGTTYQFMPTIGKSA